MQQNENAFSPIKNPNRFQGYTQSAEAIIKSYDGGEPFHLFLKKYFSAYKKHGSADRKIIASLSYSYFRTGFAVRKDIDFSEKILISYFLCNATYSNLLESLRPELNAAITLPIEHKLQLIKDRCALANLFLFSEELSDQILKEAFALSFLIQPKLFARIRQGCKKTVIEKLNKEKIPFQQITDDCLAFTNMEKIDQILEIDKEAVIQDCNSQKTLGLVASAISQFPNEMAVWDCCAGSGGKSILAYDNLPNIRLTVSDKRKSILVNLGKRFKEAGIKNYQLFLANLDKTPASISQCFNLIIADVPCSGSGTWARTPEQLTFFKKNKIEEYAQLQQKIVKNALPNLSPNGYLLYITCSVFKKENEENIQLFREKNSLKLIAMEYYKGYEIQADTMFSALLKKEK